LVSNQVAGHDECNRDQAGGTVIRGALERGATFEQSAGPALNFRVLL
jgi:hypothetical protein